MSHDRLQEASLTAFFDELYKIAASSERLAVPKSRSGRRPISVDTLLKKENDGTLFKKAFIQGYEDFGTGMSKKMKRGEVPSRDALPPNGREIGREGATNMQTQAASTLTDMAGVTT